MAKEFIRDDFVLYSTEKKPEYIYIIINGEAEYHYDGKVKIITSGTLGEWSISKEDLPIEKVIIKKGTELIKISPDNLMNNENRDRILLMMLESVSKKMLFVDEAISKEINPVFALENFKKFHNFFTTADSEYIQTFISMKRAYRNNEFEDAYRFLENIRIEDSRTKLFEEVDIWKTIIKVRMGKYPDISVFEHKDYKNNLSYNYLLGLLNNNVSGFYDLYGKYGIHFPARSVIILEGAMTNNSYAYLLLTGGLKVGRYSDGNESILSFIQNGEFFGESALFQNSVRQATVYTDKEADIILFDKEGINNILKSYPEFMLKFIKNQLKRILFLNNLLKIKKISDEKNRVKEFMTMFYYRVVKSNIKISEIANILDVKSSVVFEYISKSGYKMDPEGHLK
ncbi:MAG TPA: cyclic nucleotide-binding domain-containing protein [Tepiditoga sp.]|nr:cyclic nucleotide-binding domain-containing protein [Tepiditoga sp.]